MTERAYKRLWSLRRLNGLGASLRQVRSVLELAVPGWNGALTKSDSKSKGRIQKTALYIMLGGYPDYQK